MEVKRTEELREIINSISKKLGEVPKEDFSRFLEEAMQAQEAESSTKTVIRPFVEGVQLRNIIFETGEKEK